MKQPIRFAQATRQVSFTAVRVGFLRAATLVFSCLGMAAAESSTFMVKPPVPVPGGLSVHPVITSIGRTQDLVTVQWFGLQGPYQVLHSTSADTNAAAWQTFGASTFRSIVTAPLSGDLGFFRVLSGRPTSTAETGGTMNYVGVLSCIDCHEDTVKEWAQTPHARALDKLPLSQRSNPECLVCHTVGAGTPLGFKNQSVTPHLSGVQCENCHGPAANHIAVTRDASVRPKVSVASEICGGCHNYHHPTYSEWKSSPHATPIPDVTSGFIAQGEPRMMTCGPCHSGAVREALLEGLEHPGNMLLPNRGDAAYFAVTCAVCHDPHVNMPNPPQQPEPVIHDSGLISLANFTFSSATNDEFNPMLRNPLYSLDNYSYTPSTNAESFATQYREDIQICAQCHNMRGARWQDTSRPPHESPQYNLLVGKGGYDLGRSIIAAHGSDIDRQCVHCHSAPLEGAPVSVPTGTQSDTNYWPHTTEVSLDSCTVCHNSPNNASRAIAKTQATIKSLIATVKGLLDQWATTKAPANLQSKYGALAWEYNIPGELSNTNNDASRRGPTVAEQAAVPDAIKQARMNLYLVAHDGSFGVHNGDYSRYLLNVARTNVTAQLTE